MKLTAMICSGLIAASAALAQQPADWRPSVAEDNKAATWEQTSQFLIGALNTSGVSDTTMYFDLLTDMKANSTSRCHMNLTGTVFLTSRYYNLPPSTPMYRQLDGDLDLAKVDALSIRVIHDSNPSITALHIVMEGGDHEPIFVGRETLRYSFVQLARLNDLPKSCSLDKKGKPICVINASFSDFRYDVIVSDLELAKRMARAMSHAALVCGGAKAVSPF